MSYNPIKEFIDNKLKQIKDQGICTDSVGIILVKDTEDGCFHLNSVHELESNWLDEILEQPKIEGAEYVTCINMIRHSVYRTVDSELLYGLLCYMYLLAEDNNINLEAEVLEFDKSFRGFFSVSDVMSMLNDRFDCGIKSGMKVKGTLISKTNKLIDSDSDSVH